MSRHKIDLTTKTRKAVEILCERQQLKPTPMKGFDGVYYYHIENHPVMIREILKEL